jgi:hypothetical protein
VHEKPPSGLHCEQELAQYCEEPLVQVTPSIANATFGVITIIPSKQIKIEHVRISDARTRFLLPIPGGGNPSAV